MAYQRDPLDNGAADQHMRDMDRFLNPHKYAPPQPPAGPTFQFNGPVSGSQFGDGNTMNIEVARDKIIQAIESLPEASPEQKEEAKSLWAKTLENPTLGAILGPIVGEAVKHLMGNP